MRRKRYDIPGHARFLTFSCYQRRPLLDDNAKQLFVDQLAEVRDRFQFELFAWVLMPEHVHLLLRPSPRAPSITPILRSLKTPVAMHAVAALRRSNPTLVTSITRNGRTHFWQRGGGYDRNIRTHDELVEKAKYIDANPVRRRLADTPTQWPWSSARAHHGLPSPTLPIDPIPRALRSPSLVQASSQPASSKAP